MAQPAALTDQTILSTDPQAMELSRQQQMADLLTQNSMQQPTGQVISGRYVAPSWSQQLQPLFNAAAGAYFGGYLFDKTGSYTIVWQISIALGAGLGTCRLKILCLC